MSTDRARKGALLVAVLLLAGAWAISVVPAEDECDANVTSELIRQEEGESGQLFTWEVTATTEATCAVVGYQLTVTLRSPEGDEGSDFRVGEMRISDGSQQNQMRYQTEPGYTIADWKIEKTGCQPCVTEHPD